MVPAFFALNRALAALYVLPMNFFGHSWVAGWHGGGAAFGAGAMLPDLAGMLRLRLQPVGNSELAAGISLHHATDHVFHSGTAFRELEARAQAELSALRVRSGTRRAVAHVGVELMIDRVLARRYAPAEAGFQAACAWLEMAANSADLLPLAPPEASRRLSALVRRLAAPELSHAQLSTDSLVLRLERALEARPRLALLPEDRAAVLHWVEGSWESVERQTPAVVEGLADGLSLEAPSTGALRF